MAPTPQPTLFFGWVFAKLRWFILHFLHLAHPNNRGTHGSACHTQPRRPSTPRRRGDPTENWLPYKSDFSEAHSAQDFLIWETPPINAKSYLQTKILLFHTSPDSNSQLFCWPEVIEIAKWGCYVCHRYRPGVICIWSYRMTLTMSRLIPNDQMVDRCIGWLFNTCPSSTLQLRKPYTDNAQNNKKTPCPKHPTYNLCSQRLVGCV